jgi:hypothetical protein
MLLPGLQAVDSVLHTQVDFSHLCEPVSQIIRQVFDH